MTLSASLGEARKALVPGAFDVVLLDLQLPDGDGLDLLAYGGIEGTAFIVVTADGSLSRAISAMRIAAFDFLVKPVSGGRLLSTVRSAVDSRTGGSIPVRAASSGRNRKRTTANDFHGFIGTSPAMREIYRLIERVGPSRASVFVTGESGTGKEVTAEAIHAESGRRGAFVAVNCGAIPENLMESELFGHVKGAFTGAVENRIGAARAADGGTLFLDEICEMDLKLQVKLLRFLQTGNITRVGTSTAEPVDVRIVCATNRDVEREVREGRFREDLYYRLNVIPLALPPLRERGQDLVKIAETLVQSIGHEENRSAIVLSARSYDTLLQHPWHGNVRELQNALRRAIITARGSEVELTGLASTQRRPSDDNADIGPVAARHTQSVLLRSRGMTLAAIERQAIEEAIAAADGNVCKAAKVLDVSPSTIYRKLERWAQE